MVYLLFPFSSWGRKGCLWKGDPIFNVHQVGVVGSALEHRLQKRPLQAISLFLKMNFKSFMRKTTFWEKGEGDILRKGEGDILRKGEGDILRKGEDDM